MVSESPKWPDHLVIVRHAESERNIWKEIATDKGEFLYGRKISNMDVPLTSNGEHQAIATGRHLGAEFGFDPADEMKNAREVL
jgi:broad specificity phosphatase PhoE